MRTKSLACLLAVTAFTACSGGTSSGADQGGTQATGAAVITIQNFAFSPEDLEVSPGRLVTVMNMDSAPHTVTSEAQANDFKPGAVDGISFDTGGIPGGGSATFNIPANATSGTVISYFCSIHLRRMKNSGRITIK